MSEELEACPVCGALPCDQVELVRNTQELLTKLAKDAEEPELEMKKAFVNAASHLMAAASAYRKYAKGDPLFTTRAEDYDRAVVRARSALGKDKP